MRVLFVSNELEKIPGVGKTISGYLNEIGIRKIKGLKGKDPRELYAKSNRKRGFIQDRCLLYVFRCTVYYASNGKHEKKKLKWWNWRD